MRVNSEFYAHLELARAAAARDEATRYKIGRPVFHRPSPPSVARRVIESVVRWIAGH